MIDYSDEGWQGRNWNTGPRVLGEDMPGKSLDGFPSI